MVGGSLDALKPANAFSMSLLDVNERVRMHRAPVSLMWRRTADIDAGTRMSAFRRIASTIQ